MSFWRSSIERAIERLGMPPAAQRGLDFPPEEMRLQWEDAFTPLDGPPANPDAVACFAPIEIAALSDFNDYLWSLPPERDLMWHREHLDDPVWTEIRLRAISLLEALRSRPNR